MNDPKELERELFIAAVVGGELSMDCSEVVERLAADPNLAEELEALLGIASSVREAESMRTAALDAPEDGSETEFLAGFRDHIQATPLPPKTKPTPRRSAGGQRGWWYAAAGILVLFAGVLLLRENLLQPIPAEPESKLYLDGDESILLGKDLPFGTLQWTLSANDIFSRVSVRAYRSSSSEEGQERTLIAEYDELSVDHIELPEAELQELSQIQFVIEVQADGEPLPRQLNVTQKR